MRQYKIRYKPEADLDVVEIWMWYENQKEGLGDEFLNELDEQNQILTKHPKINPIKHKNIRKLQLKKFSKYGVFYVVDEIKNEVQIIAVMHDSRHEQNWKNRK